MENFKELKKQDVKEEEKEILEYWKKINILDECMEERKNNKNFLNCCQYIFKDLLC